MKIIVVPVGALLLCIGVYFVAYADSAPYAAYCEFDLHRLKFRFDEAGQFVNSDQVRGALEDFSSGGYTMNRLNAGPYRKLLDEESLGDGKVRLKMSQEVGRGPGSAPGMLGTVNLREQIDAVMIDTPEGWKVESLAIKEEWLDELPPEGSEG